jgi:hypothetical protein
MSIGVVPAPAPVDPDASLNWGNIGLPPVELQPGTAPPGAAAIAPGMVPEGPAAPVVAPPTPMEAAPSPPVPVAPAGVLPVTGEIKDIAGANQAEQAAALRGGNIERENADKLAAAQAEEAAKAEARAAESQRVRESQARAMDEAHHATEKALQEARDTKIPDFWAGREGKRTETALWAALGGIGAGLLGTSSNAAADIVQHNVDSYYRREKDKIDNLYKYAERRGEATQELRLNQAHELAELQAQYGENQKAVALRIASMETAGKGRVDANAANALAAKFATQGNENVLKAQKTLAEIKHLEAEAARANAKARGGAGGGGAGRGDAYDAFANAVREGKTDIGKLAFAAGFKKPGEIEAAKLAILEEADKRKKLAGEAAKGNGEAVDPKSVVYVGGQPVGMTNPRQVPAAANRFVAYRDAIRSLEELRASGNFAPSGDIYKRAVLAVAATTTANASDHTTALEAGTLSNSLGIVNNESIDRQLKHTKERFEDFKGALTPMPKPKPEGGRAGGGDPKLLESARAEVKANGPHKADAQRYIDAHGG